MWEVELLLRLQASSKVVVMVVSRRIWSLGFEPMGSSFQPEAFRPCSPPVGLLSERMVMTGPIVAAAAATAVFCTMGAGAANEEGL